jgi:hypothetical protein
MAPSLIDGHIQAVTNELRLDSVTKASLVTRSGDYGIFVAGAQTGFSQLDAAAINYRSAAF